MKATLVSHYRLRTGLILSAVFPGIFVFSNPASSTLEVVQQFATFFFFILGLWLYNFHFVNFEPVLQKRDGKTRREMGYHVAAGMLFSILSYFFWGWLFNQQQYTLSSLQASGYSFKGWFFTLLRVALFNGGICFIKYLNDSNQLMQESMRQQQQMALENETLKKEQIRAAHQVLEQQVDPHFLFNTLNTLQSLVKQDRDSALQFIRELSSVYRYMLTRRDQRIVTLQDEMNFLSSYLYLLKIRFGDAFRVQVDVGSEASQIVLPVHTLQLLAENAVKHNSITSRTPLTLTIRESGSVLEISNNLLPKNMKTVSAGIGLQNINARYQLLFGRSIRVVRRNEQFCILLPLIQKHEYPDHRGRNPGRLGFETDDPESASAGSYHRGA